MGYGWMGVKFVLVTIQLLIIVSLCMWGEKRKKRKQPSPPFRIVTRPNLRPFRLLTVGFTLFFIIFINFVIIILYFYLSPLSVKFHIKLTNFCNWVFCIWLFFCFLFLHLCMMLVIVTESDIYCCT